MEPPLDAPMPDGIELKIDGEQLTLWWTWSRGLGVFLGVFATVWFAILSIFWVTAVRTGVWPIALVTVFHLAVGLVVAHRALCNLFNVTVLAADLTSVHMRTGPIPVRGAEVAVAVDKIEQLFVRRSTSGSTNKPGDNSTSERFEVHALTKDHHDVTLVKGLTDESVAFFVEQEIEKHLEIPDRHVRGAWSRAEVNAEEHGS